MRTELAEPLQIALVGGVNQFYAKRYVDMHYIRTTIVRIHDETQSWREAGKAYGISGSMARLLANGYQPGKKVRKLLGVTRYKPRPRRAINLADAASAADTIRRHASPEFVAELAELLTVSDNEQ